MDMFIFSSLEMFIFSLEEGGFKLERNTVIDHDFGEFWSGQEQLENSLKLYMNLTTTKKQQ